MDDVALRSGYQAFAEGNIPAVGDDRVLALGHHRGRVVDGESVVIPFAHLWTLRNGHAVRFFEYADAGLVLRAQGAVAESAPA